MRGAGDLHGRRRVRWLRLAGHAPAPASIEFDAGSAGLRPDSVPVMEELRDIVQRCAALRFEIAGHTDDRGGTRDNLTLSQRRAEAAIRNGWFKDEIVPVDIPQKKGDPVRFDTDEYPRAGTTADKLAALRPAFKSDGSVTAGNASGINDGAAAVIVASHQRAASLGKRPLARVLSFASTGVDPAIMGMGPVEATRKALDRANLKASDIDLFELNEAFASQSLAVARELDLDTSKVNTRGGAIALGHPIGASGARILTTLIYALRARGGGKGLAALCIGGGMGIAMAIEVPAA